LLRISVVVAVTWMTQMQDLSKEALLRSPKAGHRTCPLHIERMSMMAPMAEFRYRQVKVSMSSMIILMV